MPRFVKIVHYGIAAVLLCLASLQIWNIASGRAAASSIWLPALCLIALVGLLRYLTWGRFLVSIISVFMAFVVAANLIPNDDDFYNGGGVLERAFGFMPSVWAIGSLIVLSAILVLLPAVIIGWRKEWFRPESW